MSNKRVVGERREGTHSTQLEYAMAFATLFAPVAKLPVLVSVV
jgi:hypothetical protein